jgi:hypothetical protein
MVNPSIHHQIMENNAWVNTFFTGSFNANKEVEELQSSKLKSFFENFLNGSFGNQLDDYFMEVTLKRWVKKFGNMAPEEFEIALKTSKKVSKHHPSNFQKTVLKSYEERMEKLNAKLKKNQKFPVEHA